MQTKTIFKNILIFCFIFSFLIVSELALATVGEATILSHFVYDEKEKLAYYVVSGMVGQVWQYNPRSGEIKKIISTAGQFPGSIDEEGVKKFEEFLLRPFKPLSRIDLRKNGIDIEVSAISQVRFRDGVTGEFFTGDIDPVNLVAKITQNNQEKGEIKFIGCFWSIEYMPDGSFIDRDFYELGINFDGFYIPDSNAILLLVSAKGWCHEGGYLRERAFPVTDLNITNPQPLSPRVEPQGGGWGVGQVNALPSIGGIFVNLPIDIKNLPIVEEMIEEGIQLTEEQKPIEKPIEQVQKQEAIGFFPRIFEFIQNFFYNLFGIFR